MLELTFVTDDTDGEVGSAQRLLLDELSSSVMIQLDGTVASVTPPPVEFTASENIT
ncbi:N-acetylmuramic acid 6-phosphate etherase [Leptospira ellinghausenii]|uniref:N-acetylmuramic acid 6-phosphate etherase n=1 Tax=Leptospira ellinghausenii TaxID=1917822 RepID=A0A2P2D8E1_9LEPT|nr:N-acetylmuramic acid 6-phosphate etherase [Leptospira ellinghausenii]